MGILSNLQTAVRHQQNRIDLIRAWIYSHRIFLLVSSILIIAAFLRFYDLGTESIWLDESESIKESALSIPDISNHSNQPPLYFLLLRCWIQLFGTGEIAVRSLSAIFGVLAIILIFLIGRTLCNNRTGLIGAFLSSITCFLIHYSQDTRAYSLLLLLSLLSYWFFIKIIKTNKTYYYPAYFLSSILLAYTHFYGLFIILSQVIFFVIFFKKYPLQRWKYFFTVAFILVSLIPFVLLLKNRISSIASDGFWISKPDIVDLIKTLVSFSGFGSTQVAITILFMLLAVFGFFIVKQNGTKRVRLEKKKYQNMPVWQTRFESPEIITLLVLWLSIPILVPFLESQFMTPIYLSKYAIGAYPALCLLVAKGLDNIKWEWVFYPVLVLIIILSSLGINSYYKIDIKEQWREVAQYIGPNSKSGDLIVFSESYYSGPFNYYYKGNLPESGIMNLEDAQKFVSSQGNEVVKNRGRIWFVLAHNKSQMAQYLVSAYGEKTIGFSQQYVGITVIRFDFADSVK